MQPRGTCGHRQPAAPRQPRNVCHCKRNDSWNSTIPLYTACRTRCMGVCTFADLNSLSLIILIISDANASGSPMHTALLAGRLGAAILRAPNAATPSKLRVWRKALQSKLSPHGNGLTDELRKLRSSMATQPGQVMLGPVAHGGFPARRLTKSNYEGKYLNCRCKYIHVGAWLRNEQP